LRDERTIFPVASYQQTYRVTLALPSVVGRGGIVRVLEPPMSADERAQLQRSAERLQAAGHRLRVATASS
jgi:L-lactate dehydrogenase